MELEIRFVERGHDVCLLMRPWLLQLASEHEPLRAGHGADATEPVLAVISTPLLEFTMGPLNVVVVVVVVLYSPNTNR